jgi:hypothetical protein
MSTKLREQVGKKITPQHNCQMPQFRAGMFLNITSTFFLSLSLFFLASAGSR